MKYFYAAVVDAYQYSDVTDKRFKNFVDYVIYCWEEDFEDQLRKYLYGNDEEEIDYIEFLDENYGYTTYYFAMDENGNELEDLEDNNVTMRDIGIGIYPIHIFDHMPCCIGGYVDEFKQR